MVVYVLADQAFVESLDGLPVTDPDRLDGVDRSGAPRRPRPGGPVSSYRIVLSPHVLDESDEVLDRLVRHELTHVALGDHARGVPLWLAEGLAEYVSVRPVAPAERRLQTDALNLAAAGVADVPSDSEFGGAHAEGWYAVSWWVCEYIAATYGEACAVDAARRTGRGWRPADGGPRPAGDHHVRARPRGHRADAPHLRVSGRPIPRSVSFPCDPHTSPRAHRRRRAGAAGVEDLRMVVALDGFLDAGNAGAIACRHLVAEGADGGGVVVATFDVDQLHDYRARRPPMSFVRDHYEAYDAPRLVVRLLHDEGGTPYLLLHGPEPDTRWEASAGACSRSSSGSRCRW